MPLREFLKNNTFGLLALTLAVSTPALAAGTLTQIQVNGDLLSTANPMPVTGGSAIDANGNDKVVIYDAAGNALDYTTSTQVYQNGAAVTVVDTRTSDTSAYTAGDVVGAATGSTAALAFAAVGPSGHDILVMGAELRIDATAVLSGETSYNLYCYSITPPSALGDNAAFDISSGDRASYLTKIPLGTPVDEGSTLYVRNDSVDQHMKLVGTGTWCYLVTVGAYTPTSARVYNVTLHTVAY